MITQACNKVHNETFIKLLYPFHENKSNIFAVVVAHGQVIKSNSTKYTPIFTAI